MSNLRKKLTALFKDYGNSLLLAGSKLERKAFEGNLGLRGRTLGGAARLAQQGKLGKN